MKSSVFLRSHYLPSVEFEYKTWNRHGCAHFFVYWKYTILRIHGFKALDKQFEENEEVRFQRSRAEFPDIWWLGDRQGLHDNVVEQNNIRNSNRTWFV